MSTPPLAGAGMPPGAFSGTQAQAAREVNTASLCRIGQETVQDIVFRTMEIFQLLRNMQLPNGVTYHAATYQDRLAKLQEHLRQLSILFRKLRLVYDKCNENCAGLDPVPIEEKKRRSGQIFYKKWEKACFKLSPVNLAPETETYGSVHLEILRQGILALSKLTKKTVHYGLLQPKPNYDSEEITQLIPYVEEDGSKHDDRGAASQLRFASEERREIMEVNKKLKQKNQQLKQIMDQLRNLIWDINAMLAMRN